MTALIFTTIVVDYSTFTNAFKGPFAFNALKEVGVDSVWPNVYTTVAELNPSSLDNIITQLGSNSLLFFFLALMGIIFALGKKENLKRNDIYYLVLAAAWYIIVLIIKPQNLIVFLSLIALPIAIRIFLEMYNKKTDIDYKLAIMLVIWFMATIYASTKGVRFTLLLVPAFSISIGIAFGYCYKYLANFLNLNLYLNKKLSKALVALALLLLLLPTVILANGIVKQSVPLINDAWYNSLDAINMQSNPDAIINSWWDYGHWFKYVGGRAVTFDGTSQATPMAHWIGHSLLTNNENDSTGILKMLDCGSNLAFEKLDESINDIAKSVYIIHDIVKTDRKNAKNYLLRYVDDAKAEEVLKYTHCTPPENYFITSDDMIGKSGVWGHFGIWDFNRALIYNTLKRNDYENNKDKSVQFITSRFNYSKEEAEKIYFEVRSVRTSEEANSWIAPWPSYASNVGSCNSDGQDILCPISMQSVKGNLNLRVNLGNKTAYIDTPNGKYYPNSLVYPTKDKIEKLTYTNNTIGYSVTLIPEEGGWRYILMIPPLEDSIFTQLYFLDGHGLSKFKKVTEHRSITGNRIVVWKVDWNGTQKNILPYFSERNSTIPNAPINT
jgi:dolichyl-diphosphooligosaccharide--protein glycosyltransferase